MLGLINFLITWAKYASTILLNYLIDIVNAAIVGFVALITAVVALFPTSITLPTTGATPTNSTWVTFVQTINWIFPMGLIIQGFTYIAAVYLAYIVIAPLARWAKLTR